MYILERCILLLCTQIYIHLHASITYPQDMDPCDTNVYLSLGRDKNLSKSIYKYKHKIKVTHHIRST